jgi:hypothetical protein
VLAYLVDQAINIATYHRPSRTYPTSRCEHRPRKVAAFPARAIFKALASRIR